MFEKMTQVAEQAATNISRRGFLSRFTTGALAAAAALGGLLARPYAAGAGRGQKKVCSEDSALLECQGKPVGSPCQNSGEGRCWGKDEISPGVVNCNICKRKGKTKPPR